MRTSLPKFLRDMTPNQAFMVSVIGGCIYFLWMALLLLVMSGAPSNYQDNLALASNILFIGGGIAFILGLGICLLCSLVLVWIGRLKTSRTTSLLYQFVSGLWLLFYLVGLVLIFLAAGMGASG